MSSASWFIHLRARIKRIFHHTVLSISYLKKFNKSISILPCKFTRWNYLYFKREICHCYLRLKLDMLFFYQQILVWKLKIICISGYVEHFLFQEANKVDHFSVHLFGQYSPLENLEVCCWGLYLIRYFFITFRMNTNE